MASKPESKLTRQLIAHLREKGAWAEKIHGNIYQSGLPDIVGCLSGVFLGIEVKMPGRKKKLTALQQRTLDRIEAAGGVAGVVTSVEELDDLLQEYGCYEG